MLTHLRQSDEVGGFVDEPLDDVIPVVEALAARNAVGQSSGRPAIASIALRPRNAFLARAFAWRRREELGEDEEEQEEEEKKRGERTI